MLRRINSQVVHLRQTPDAERKKKIENILKEGRKAREASSAAEASVNDKAGSICWFCHADVSNLENNKCAGCRKVTHVYSVHCTPLSSFWMKQNLLLQARYCDERCQRADWGRHGGYCVKVQEKIRRKTEAKNAKN